MSNDSVADLFDKLTALNHLHLAGNRLYTTPRGFVSLINLKSLDVMSLLFLLLLALWKLIHVTNFLRWTKINSKARSMFKDCLSRHWSNWISISINFKLSMALKRRSNSPDLVYIDIDILFCLKVWILLTFRIQKKLLGNDLYGMPNVSQLTKLEWLNVNYIDLLIWFIRLIFFFF